MDIVQHYSTCTRNTHLRVHARYRDERPVLPGETVLLAGGGLDELMLLQAATRLRLCGSGVVRAPSYGWGRRWNRCASLDVRAGAGVPFRFGRNPT